MRITKCLWLIVCLMLLVGCKSAADRWQEQYNLGVRYLSEGNYEEAVLAFTAAIEIDPKRSDTYLSLAEIYMELGEYEKAVEILEQGIGSIGENGTEELINLLGRAGRMASIDFDNLVTDAFHETLDSGGSGTTSEWTVPKIMLPNAEISSINDEIWENLYEKLFQAATADAAAGSPVGDGVSYQWAVNGDILSLWVEANPMPWAWTEYYVYNISITKGERLEDQEVYSAAGLSSSEYYERVRQAAGSSFWNFGGDYSNADLLEMFGNMLDYFNAQLENTIAEENVRQAKPFLDTDGHLCVVVPVYSMAGADYYWQEIDLDDFELVPDYDKGLGSAAPEVNISEDEAYELVREHWNYVPGTVVEETGYELFLNSFGSRTGSNGRIYYEIRLQWLVDADTEWGHLSTIDVMYVDAGTGELVGDELP